jgi:hypothetical protein
MTGRIWPERAISSLAGDRLVTALAAGAGGPIVAIDPIDVSAGNSVLPVTDEAARA